MKSLILLLLELVLVASAALAYTNNAIPTTRTTTSFLQRTATATTTTTTITRQPRQHHQYHHHKRIAKFTTFLQSSYSNNDQEDETEEGNLSPSQMKWLEDRSISNADPEDGNNDETTSDAAERLAGNVNVPKTGVSINDQMSSVPEKFMSTLFALDTSSGKSGAGNDADADAASAPPVAAAIQTITGGTIGDEPMRYIVALDADADADADAATTGREFAMVDIPPYSDDLVLQIKNFMSSSEEEQSENTAQGTLSTILVTSKDSIHYDQAPAVYVTRKSDLDQWKKAFPDAKVVMYRLDTPRDCKEALSQSLDGYGPWGMGGSGSSTSTGTDMEGQVFVETGRPLTRMEWDDDVQASVLDNGEVPPDDNDEDTTTTTSDDELYTPQAIKKREEDKSILAVYTPGHTFGSVTYIFPKVQICCSGYTIPVEDTRSSASAVGLSTAGPALDYRGYITTNTGGIDRQIESARQVVDVYGDRFEIVLPSRGPPVTLGQFGLSERRRILHDMLNEFAQLGKVYESMGII